MSTILKALRRLEEERTANGPRPLREEVATAPQRDESAPSRRWPLVVPLLLLLIAGLGVGGAQLLDRWRGGEASDGSDVAAQAVEPAPEARVAVAPPSPRVAPAPRAPEPAVEKEEAAGLPAHAFASPVEVVKRPPAEPRVPIEYARAADPPSEPVVEPAPPVKAAPAKRKPVARRPEPAARRAESVVAKPSPEPTAVESSAPPAPVASAPDVRVEKTLWHPDADRRVAFVAIGDGAVQRVQEGDVLGRYVVSEIQPSGVVFLADGKPVRRAIGAH